MIIHAELDQNQDTDTSKGPAIRLKARRLGSVREQRQHALLLVPRQA